MAYTAAHGITCEFNGCETGKVAVHHVGYRDLCARHSPYDVEPTCTDANHTDNRHHWGMCEEWTESAPEVVIPNHVHPGATVSAQFWGGAARIALVSTVDASTGLAWIMIGGKAMQRCVSSLYAV